MMEYCTITKIKGFLGAVDRVRIQGVIILVTGSVKCATVRSEAHECVVEKVRAVEMTSLLTVNA